MLRGFVREFGFAHLCQLHLSGRGFASEFLIGSFRIVVSDVHHRSEMLHPSFLLPRLHLTWAPLTKVLTQCGHVDDENSAILGKIYSAPSSLDLAGLVQFLAHCHLILRCSCQIAGLEIFSQVLRNDGRLYLNLLFLWAARFPECRYMNVLLLEFSLVILVFPLLGVSSYFSNP